MFCPEGDEDSQSKIIVKKYNANSKAYYVLLQALNDDDISRVINYTCAHDICQVLITTHESTTQVQKVKIDLLNSQYDTFTVFMKNPLVICSPIILQLLMDLFL